MNKHSSIFQSTHSLMPASSEMGPLMASDFSRHDQRESQSLGNFQSLNSYGPFLSQKFSNRTPVQHASFKETGVNVFGESWSNRDNAVLTPCNCGSCSTCMPLSATEGAFVAANSSTPTSSSGLIRTGTTDQRQFSSLSPVQLKTGNAEADTLLYGNGRKWDIQNLTFGFNDLIKESDPWRVSYAQRTMDQVAGFTNLTFREVANYEDANIQFKLKVESENYGSSQASIPGSTYSGNIWMSPNEYRMGAYAHELGHALGLSHTFNDTGRGVLSSQYDSGAYSVMTYNNKSVSSFSQLDITALQGLYGANYNYNSGNTVYKILPDEGAISINGQKQAVYTLGSRTIQPIAFTIWDGGGIDTYDFSNSNDNQSISLQAGGFSTVLDDGTGFDAAPLGLTRDPQIANALLFKGDTRALIENVTTGAGNDKVLGNQANNRLIGGTGDDTLWGMNGNDYLAGQAGNDTLGGGSGNDRLFGGSGDDRLFASPGDDALEGGAGNDTFIIGEGDGNDIISDWGGTDTIQFNGLSLQDFQVTLEDNTLIFTHRSTGDTTQVKNGGVGAIESYQFSDGTFDTAALQTLAIQAQNDTFSFNETEIGGWYDSGNLLSNDKSDGASLNVTEVNGVSIGAGRWVKLDKGRIFVSQNGRIDFNANGEFDYLKNGETAQVVVPYTVVDDRGQLDSATFTIKVNGVG